MDKVDLSSYGKPAAPRVSPGGVALPQEKPSLTGPDLSSYGKPAGASLGKYAKEFGKATVAGTGQMLGSIAKGAAVMQTVDPKELDTLEHRIKNIKTLPYEEANDLVQNMALTHLKALDVMPWVTPKYQMAARAFWKGDSDKGNTYLKEARAASETRPLDQQPLYKQGEEYQKEFEDPNHAMAPGKGWENSNTKMIGNAAGSMLPFFAAGPLGAVARPLAIAGVGGLAQTDQQHDMAQGALDRFNKEGGAFTMPGEKPSPFIGMTPEQAQALVMHESKIGFLPGMTEDAPIELLIDQSLGRIPWLRAARGSPMWTKFLKMAGRIGLQVTAEGGQEAGQQYLTNLIHQMNTDPNQPLSEGLLQNFLVGGLLGGGIQAGIEVAKPFIPNKAPPVVLPPPGGPGSTTAGVPPAGPAGPAGPGAGPTMPPMGNGAGMAPQPQIIPQGQLPDLSKYGRPAGPAPGAAPMAPPPGSNYAAEREAMNKNPTEGQSGAGNYRKGHVKFQGFNVSLETARGNMRRSKDPKNPWEVQMPVDYGYFRGHKGADGDNLDVFIGPDQSAENAYVIDQIDLKTGKFDELKSVLGARSAQDAMHIYDSSFSDGKGIDRIGGIVEMPMAEFRDWLKNGGGTKPLGESNARERNTRTEPNTGISDLGADQTTLPQSQEQEVPVLRGAGDNNLSGVAIQLPDLSGFGRKAAVTGADTGQGGQREGVRAGEPAVDGLGDAIDQSQGKDTGNPERSDNDSGAGIEKTRVQEKPGEVQTGAGNAGGKGADSTSTAGPSASRSELDEAAAGLDALFGDTTPSTEQEPSDEGAVDEPKTKTEPKPEAKAEPESDAGTGRKESATEPAQEETTAGPTEPRGKEEKIDENEKEKPTSVGENTGGPSVATPEEEATKPDETVKPEGKTGDEAKPKNKKAASKSRAKITKAPPSTDGVVEAFRDFLANPENSFPTYVEARRFAEKNGFKVERGTIDNKLLQEKIELALVLAAKDIVAANKNPAVVYRLLTDLYTRQPNLGARTSESVSQQAYSTPLPLAYLAQNMAEVTQSTTIYEPTAGNGALIFTAAPKKVHANELNDTRANHLREQGYMVTQGDATTMVEGDKVDVVLANPPFGTVRTHSGIKLFKVDGWETNQIDHVISLMALKDMKADGKAVLIVGSVRDGESRPTAYNGAKRSFFWRLYTKYNVVDHFTVSGDLYKKQGAAWPVDVIVIDGVGKSKMSLPSIKTPLVYADWEELGEKINERIISGPQVFDASDTGAGKPSGEGAALEGNSRPTGNDDSGERPATGGGAATEPGESDGLRNESDRGSGSDAGEQQSSKSGGTEVGSGVSGEPGGSGKSPSDLELRSTFAGIIEQLKKEQAEKVTPRKATAASELASAAKETLSGLDEAATGLFELFNDPDKLGAGLSFDEETYAKAKPFFEKAWQHFKSAATDVASAMNLLMRHMMETMNWTIEKLVQLEPYITRFVKDKMAEGEAVELGESETQKPYKGQSKMPSLDTLIPTNMRDVTTEALDRLREEKGDLDEFVSQELGYSLSEKSPDWMGNFLGGEQVDAIALAIDNAQKGKGFIIGDQTGIGKGRVIAGVIRYALKNKMSPIFVTHKPNLYGDIIRDLNDLEVPKMAGRKLRLFITNRGETIPLDLEALQWFEEAQEADAAGEKIPPKVGEFLKSPTPKQHAEDEAAILKDGGVGLEKSFDIVFTTYNQMQTVKKGETDRRNLMRAIGPNSFILMDESHNAGGDEMKRPKVAGTAPDAATFLRGIAGQAKAVLFSSATYAKRPHTMGLYGRTDMGLAVEKISQLGGLIAQGGVPMQQIVASMLTKAGQYVRRERSFEGIRYDVVPVAIIPDAYNKFSRSVRDTFKFDIGLKDSEFWGDLLDSLKPEGAVVLADGSTGDGSASSTNFTSIMHNLVAQMLLSIKADSVAEQAITAIKNGEKPVITVSGTMGAFIENAADTLDLTAGDKLNMSFKDVAKRYLRRVMRITIKTPQIDGPDKITYYQVEPDDLPPSLRQGYDDALESITAMVAEDMPLSPIDWIKFRIQEAGYNVGEITGRKHTMKYTGRAEATYQTRSEKEVGTAGRVSSINRFNNETGEKELHALILNRAGSTGLSLHAGKKFKNQKPRAMIIAQAEGNIDEHMQLLGRVNRTGQTVLPRYEQAYADIPAEARPAAILAKKMASLNANTTASRRGAFSGDEDVDFNNKYGDQIVYQMMLQNPDLQARTNIKLSKDGVPENLLAKFTGKLTVFEIEEQEQILDAIKDQYKDLIAELDAAGENDLEAKTEDLRAKTIDTYELKSGTGPGPFQQAVNLETVEIKSAGRAYSVPVIIEAIETATSVKADPAITDDARRLSNLAARAQAANQDTAKYWYNLWIEHGKTVMATFKNEETRRRHRAELVAEQKQWEWIFERVKPGSRVTLTVGENEPVTVITVEVDRRQKEKLTKGSNPLALGAWTVTFAMPDNSQRLIVPFSSIGGYSHGVKEKDEIEDKKRIKISQPSFYDNFEKLAKIYEAAAHEGKEIRHIVTGNILAAFDQVKARGQILNYTTEDGTVQPGVLMPRAWKKDTFLENRNVQFHSGRQVLEFLKIIKQGASVLSRDLMISIDMLWNGFIKFSINKSKSKGGVYWDRPDVKDITGTMPESGGFFTYQTNDHFKAESLADALLNAGAILEVNKEQDTAKEVVDKFPTQSEAEAQMKGDVKAPKTSVDSIANKFNEFLSGKKAAEKLFLMNRVYGLADKILGHKIEVKVVGRITNPDGTESPTAAFYDSKTKSITASISAMANLFDALSTIGHEAIHALRDMGVFTKEEWAILRADALKAEYASGKRLIDAVRADYTHYPERFTHLTEAQLEDLYEEEAVAFMIGQYMANREESDLMRSGARRIVDKIFAFLRAVRDFFVGEGFAPLKTTQEIAETIYSGIMAERTGEEQNRADYRLDGSVEARIRPPRNLAPGSFIEPFDERMETAWRDYNSTMMERVSRVLTSGFKQGVHNFQDDKWDVKRAQNAIEAFNGVKLPETLDVYGGASLYPTRTAERLRLLLENYVKPLITEIAGRNLTIPQVNKFLIAMHVPERNDSIGTMYHPGDQYYEAMYNPSLVGGSGWSNDRAANVIANARADGSYASLMMIAKRVWALNESNLRILLNEGLITQPIYDDLVIKWQYYVPLRGEENVIDYDNPDISWKGKGHDMRVKEFHQALGRTSGADSPLGYSLLQARQGIEHVENNRVAKRLLRLATRYQNDAFWKINLVQMKRYQDKATGFVKYAYDRSVHLAPEDFAAKIHGQIYHITLYHEGFRNGMKNMGKNQMVGFVRALHKAMRGFTLVNTGLNPSFLFSNFERDLQTAATYMQDSQLPTGLAAGVIKGVPAAVAAMNRYLRNDFAPNDQMALWAREFALAGGKMGYMDRFDINATNREVDSLMAEANPRIARRMWMALRDQGIKRVERYNESIENGIRLSLYIALRTQGQSGATAAHVLANPIPRVTVPRDVAARASQEITINFSRKGKFTPTMNAFYPFFGASMQGIVGGLKFTARSPKIQKILIGIMLAGLLQDLLNRMLAGDDDDGKNRYDKIPWSIKQRYFIIMNSKSMQDAGYPPYTKVAPLGHYLSFFHNIGTILGGVTAGDMEILPAVGNLVTSIQNNFVPFSGSDDVASMLTPTIGDPFLEILRNQDYFGDPIEPKVFDETIPHSQRFKSNIPAWWRDIAEDVNALTGGNKFQKGYVDLSPEWLEHLAGFATGGAGRFLSDFAQTVETMAEGELPESTKVPILKLFAGQPPIYNDRDAYFAIKDAVHVADRERDSYPTGSAARDAFERSHQRELQMVTTLKIADRLIGNYRKQYDSTLQWPDSPEKQAQLKRLTDQSTEEMRKVRLQWNIPWTPAP